MTLKFHPHPKPSRLSPCHRHPDQPLSPLCAPCLRERLSLLNPSSSSSSSSATSVAATASSSSSSSSAALPELRRSKTFSGDKCERLGIGLSYEPRRISCEVRARSTLEDLFTVDDKGDGVDAGSSSKCKVESMNLGLLRGTYPVPELREEEDEESDCEIRVSADVIVASDLNVDEEIEDSKTIKELVDLELKNSKPARRDFKEIAGSFWIAASVFSKKLQKWKRRQKSERPDGDCHRRCRGKGFHGFGEMRLERLRGSRLRDTQSELGEYGFGRRSCDTDPRASIDLGRASIDGSRISVDGIGKRFFDTDPRFSLDLARASVDCSGIPIEESNQRCFDPPRASWDGRTNKKPLPRATTPVVSVIENAMATVYGFDNGSMVAEKPNIENETIQGTKLLITEKELMSSRINSINDDSSISFDTTSKDMTTTSSASSSSNGTSSKKSMKWGKFLNVWGLLSGQKQHKPDDDVGKVDRRNKNCSIGTSGGERESNSLSLNRRGVGSVLSRNRSVKYSPNGTENGSMLRFYLTPLRRSKVGKNKLNRSHSLARAVLKIGSG